jgi:sigma-E factor negative regulatory protein RseC
MSGLNIESARIVAISDDAIWVETIQKSTCANCASRSGCGQYLLGKWRAEQDSRLKIPFGKHQPSDFQVGDYVSIGVPEGMVLKFAIIVYMLPVVWMLGGALFAQHLLGSDLAAAVGAVIGLVVGFGSVMAISKRAALQSYNHPVLVAGNSDKNCHISATVVELS